MALTIGDLLKGRDKPLSVRPTERLNSAIEQMLRHDYSQLAVTTDGDKLIGVITSDSILSSLEAFGLSPSEIGVADAMTKPRSFDPDADVSDLLNALRDHYAALVVDGDGKLIGIVTGFDASEYFRRRSEDIMLVEDIESSIKDHVLAAFQDGTGKVDQARLADAILNIAHPSRQLRAPITKAVRTYLSRSGITSEPDQALIEQLVADCCDLGNVPSFDRLTLSHYIDLLLHQATWATYSDVFGISVGALRRLLNSVRDTRNALAHFRGEISATDRERLRYCAEWLDRHAPRRILNLQSATVVGPVATGAQVAELVLVDDEVGPGESRYAKLAVWLQKAGPSQDAIELTFNQIEEVLGGPLPASAREHRSWWANDSVCHPQSRRWLEVGWRVASLSLAEEIATFTRIEERESAYIGFFSELLAKLERTAGFPRRASSPSGASWQTLARMPESGPFLGWLVCSFTRGERIRAELYIDTKDATVNKDAFDRLVGLCSQVEEAFGSSLSWERLDKRRASRVAIYTDGAITWDSADLAPLVSWASDAIVRIQAALSGPVERVMQSLVKESDVL